jgi:PAS domain S-box-containing protein
MVKSETGVKKSGRATDTDYRVIAEAAEDSIYIIDREMKVLYVNTHGANQLGGSPEMIEGQSIKKLFPPPAAEHQLFSLNQVFNTGKPVLHEDWSAYGDQNVWLNTRLVPVKDESGRVKAIIGFSRDITDRKVAEIALERSEAELKRQLKYAKAINRLAAFIISTKATQALLDQMVEVIGSTLDLDRALIYRVDFNENVVEGMSEWLNPNTPGLESTKRRYNLDMFLRGAVYMWKQRKPLISHYNEVNPELVGDGSSETLHGAMNIKSLLWYPFYFGDKQYYALTFNQVANRRDWTKEELEFSATVADQVTVAILKLASLKEQTKTDKALQDSTDHLRRVLEETVNALAVTAEKKDPYTAGHQERVVKLATAIAREMNLSEDRIEGVRIAAMVHDIGKIYIPAEILVKPATLNDLEFGMVRSHSQFGFDILKTIDFPWPIAKAVLQHHERIDGSGYPLGLKGDQICLEAKILAVSDVVESMCSHRPYRPKLGVKKALAEITSGRGTLYDPAVADACAKLFEDGFKFE